MKQIIILLVIAVVGVVLWLGTQDATDEPSVPSAETSDTIEQPATPVATNYVGLSEVEAEALATQNGVPFRVVERDGEMLPTTRDFREGRINAVVEDEMVVSYTVEGEGAESELSDEADTSNDDGSTSNDAPVSNNGVNSEHVAIIGLTQAEAEAYAEENDVAFRIGSVDGEARPVTMDYRPGRITADIEAGVVTGYSVE